MVANNAMATQADGHGGPGVGGTVVANPAQCGFVLLNTPALDGGVNGNINQVIYKATSFGVNNQSAAFVSNGSAASVGTTVAQGMVNVITVKYPDCRRQQCGGAFRDWRSNGRAQPRPLSFVGHDGWSCQVRTRPRNNSGLPWGVPSPRSRITFTLSNAAL